MFFARTRVFHPEDFDLSFVAVSTGFSWGGDQIECERDRQDQQQLKTAHHHRMQGWGLALDRRVPIAGPLPTVNRSPPIGKWNAWY